MKYKSISEWNSISFSFCSQPLTRLARRLIELQDFRQSTIFVNKRNEHLLVCAVIILMYYACTMALITLVNDGSTRIPPLIRIKLLFQKKVSFNT